jgi:hypothetical protein
LDVCHIHSFRAGGHDFVGRNCLTVARLRRRVPPSHSRLYCQLSSQVQAGIAGATDGPPTIHGMPLPSNPCPPSSNPSFPGRINHTISSFF